MKDYLLFNIGLALGQVSDWLFQKVSDEYLIAKEESIDREVEEHMFDLGLTKFTIFHVNEGPMHRDYIPDDEGVPDRCEWMMEVKCRINDQEEVVDIPLWFEEFNEAYSIVSHFYNSVEPKVVFV